MLDMELEALEAYSEQLQSNMDSTVESYNTQFTSLSTLINENNSELT